MQVFAAFDKQTQLHTKCTSAALTTATAVHVDANVAAFEAQFSECIARQTWGV